MTPVLAFTQRMKSPVISSAKRSCDTSDEAITWWSWSKPTSPVSRTSSRPSSRFHQSRSAWLLGCTVSLRKPGSSILTRNRVNQLPSTPSPPNASDIDGDPTANSHSTPSRPATGPA